MSLRDVDASVKVASHAEANVTMLSLIRDGLLRRTFDGRLTLRGSPPVPTPIGRTVVLAVFLLAVLGFMAWVVSNLIG